MKTPAAARFSRSRAHPQRGVVLLIALIVLVAMTLAAIGMTRSIDTANVVAGNLGFKQSTLNAGDNGLDAGFQWVLARAGTVTLNNTDMTAGYFSDMPPTEPDWTNPATWANAMTLNGGVPDAAGNVVSYLIHRMCTEANTTYNGVGGTGNQNLCALIQPTSSGTTCSSMKSKAVTFPGNPQIYYRITSRVQGPRNTESYVQSLVAISN